jgi:hypothetical protein
MFIIFEVRHSKFPETNVLVSSTSADYLELLVLFNNIGNIGLPNIFIYGLFVF